ncbi:MAG: hypothetical protein M0D55_05240 [Elusimicrobiota bacterium]|nr:MAG: hypothetical protein M0D55_05240 [Elusimicrobiota bacterium]
MAPPTNCLSPIGEKAILSGLYKQIKGTFYTAVTRPPAVYRGNPFVIEAGLAWGRGPEAEKAAAENAPQAPLAEGESDEREDNELARVMRFANRVPLQYQQAACSTFKAVLDTTWKNYGIGQSRGAPPQGPMVIFVHMASVWVPFTSESKEAIADYDEIKKEITLALREAGRRLGVFIKRRDRAHAEYKRRNVFELYIDEVVAACKSLKGGKIAEAKLHKELTEMAKKLTGGEKTDSLVDKNAGPHGLPHSIIVTAEGVEGEVPLEGPVVVEEAAPAGAPGAEPEVVEAEKPAKKAKNGKAPKQKAKAKAKTAKPKRRRDRSWPKHLTSKRSSSAWPTSSSPPRPSARTLRSRSPCARCRT